jgi:hypothetical protein
MHQFVLLLFYQKNSNMDQASVLPRILAYTLLEKMTNGFSKDRELGRGAYGVVYQVWLIYFRITVS